MLAVANNFNIIILENNMRSRQDCQFRFAQLTSTVLNLLKAPRQPIGCLVFFIFANLRTQAFDVFSNKKDLNFVGVFVVSPRIELGSRV